MISTTLYRLQKNKMRTWTVVTDMDDHRIMIKYGMEGGSYSKKSEVVKANKSGRSIYAQVLLRAESRINKMLDKGYKRTRQEALDDTSNRMGFTMPMLAQAYSKVSPSRKKEIGAGTVMQRKLDGHRCMITRTDRGLVAYSRLGKPITSIKHIFDAIGNRIPVGSTIDGELYQHKVALQTISSRIKKYQKGVTERIKFIAFDIVANEPFIARHKSLIKMLAGCGNRVLVLPYFEYTSEVEMWKFFHEGIKSGFEGAMLRIPDQRYDDGRRSRNLLKVKEQLDADFRVTDISESSDGWAVLTCKMECGVLFDVSAPGTIEQKTDALHNRGRLIGRFVNVKYACLTNSGRPFHAVATRWLDRI